MAAALKGIDTDGRPVTAQMTPVPGLTGQKIGQTPDSVPTNSSSLQCWSCQDRGHRYSNWPHLTALQRIVLAHGDSLHQIEQNTVVEEWCEQKRLAVKAQGPTMDHSYRP